MTRAARLGRALGPSLALWFVVPALLHRAAPGAPWWLVIALGAVGFLAHLGCRFLSNRSWFSGPRSRVALVVAALTVASALAAALTGIAVVGHTFNESDRNIDILLIIAAWATSTIALAGAFSGRVEFRSWLLRHAAVRDRTRPFASAPIGPDRAAIVDLLDDLTKGRGERAPTTDLPALARRLRLTSDERYRRLVPWAVARPLLAAAAEHAEAVGDISVRLATGEGGDKTRVVIGPIVDLVHELAAARGVLHMVLISDAESTDAVTVTVASHLDPMRRGGPRITPTTARALDQVVAVVRRPDPDELTVTTTFRNERSPDVDPEIETALSAPAELLAVSPFSAGARSVYRRGSSVVKVQRHDRFDPKPTLLEDEFHLLRRLRSRSARFPAAVGYGIERTFSWIAYDYVDGRPLDEWLAAHRDEAPSRLLSFGVDLHEMLVELASCRIAHRDLNPGNLIVDDTGGLVLIDFDQAASGLDYVGADRNGVDAGLAKNDLVEFLERARLTRAANELLSALGEAWPSAGVPFSLGVLGFRFGEGWPIEPLLSAARTRLGPLQGCRVLDLQRAAPIAGLMLASAGADVTAVVDEPERWGRLASLVAPRLKVVAENDRPATPFDLTVALDDDQTATARPSAPGTVLIQQLGGPDEPIDRSPWFTTTMLTQVGPAGS
jgi:predicted Ser/Thr protein kinase